MLDLHFAHLLKNGLHYYLKDRFMFDPLFPMLSSTMAEKLFNHLNSNKIDIDFAFVKQSNTLPLITISISEQEYAFATLGDIGGSSERGEGRTVLNKNFSIKQNIDLNIYAKDLDTLRGLTHLVHCIITLFKNSLLKKGYLDIVFTGSSSVKPISDLQTEGSQIYARKMSFSSIYHQEISSYIEDLNNIGELEPLLPIKVYDKQTAIDLGYDYGVDIDNQE